MSERSLIFVVDDDPSILTLMEAILEEEPVRLVGADSGREALEELGRGLRPDLMILDLMMPGMGGLDVLQETRVMAGFEQVPVILLTARSRSEDVVVGLEAGATDYVTKPFHLAELKARVRAALRLRGLFLELAEAREAALHQERLKVLVETAGGMAHAVNQPLTAALLTLERLQGREGAAALRTDLEFVFHQLEKVADAVRRIQQLTTYRTTEYVEGIEILDVGTDEP